MSEQAASDALSIAAENIARELICCDVFERLSKKRAGERTPGEKAEARSHSICYWGEAARRIVLHDMRLCHCGVPVVGGEEPASWALCETCLPLRCDAYPGACRKPLASASGRA